MLMELLTLMDAEGPLKEVLSIPIKLGSRQGKYEVLAFIIVSIN